MHCKSISEALFTKTQQKVLRFFYGNPENSYYLNEVVRLARRKTIEADLKVLYEAA